ncbi:MAG: AAA family ATPase [Oscillospiraceae bacterium]|nr:AAA family ATPase [Oscillospiraceae bacterium]
MKLISLHIENFGCLHDYDLKFGEGLTVLREDNGFGKTTLVEFIRAMFYGFPRAAKTLDKNRRKKYLPWSGAKCGGHLTFELEGTRYRVERTFGATPRGDSFNLIDLTTNQKSGRFSEKLGLEIFQLDADSFERSTYLPQVSEAGPLTTGSIRAKLGDLVEDTNDINNFDKAVKALKEKRSAFVPYRGSGGSVAEARARVSELQEELDRAEGKKAALASAQTEIAELEAGLEQDSRELAAVREQITRASQAAAANTVRRQYEDLLAQRRQAREAVEGEARFRAGVPSAEDFEGAQQRCGQYLSLSAELRGCGLSAGEQAQLEALRRFFAPGVPGEEKLEELTRRQQELLRLRTVAENQKLSTEERQSLTELEDYFRQGIPEEQALDSCGADLDRAAALRQENLRLAGARQEESGGKGPLAALIMGVLALAAGIGLMAARSFVLGGALLGVGILALLSGAYLHRQRGNRRKTAERAYRQNETEAARLEERVRDFAGQYSGASAPGEALREIRDRRGAYLTLLARQREQDGRRAETLRAADAAKTALQRELAAYFEERIPCEQGILQLRLKRGQLLDLEAKASEAAQRQSQLQARKTAIEGELSGFLGNYFTEVTPEQFQSLLARLRRDCDEYTRNRTLLRALEAQTDAFRAEHRAVLEGPAAETEENLDGLKLRERQLAAHITERTRLQLERKQLSSRLREEIDRIPQLRDGLDFWQEKKDGDQKKSETLDRTLDFLQQARDSLSGNYLGTIQKRFGDYLGRMTGEDREKILVTGDLEVQLERQGQTRELGYFSAGQGDLVMLCMRMALVDALFTDVKPFVILDDPFVNLDDERTERALELLRDLAGDRQILYLTCNSSRM